MNEHNDLMPQQGELMSLNENSIITEEIFNKMFEQLQVACISMQFQKLSDVENASASADAIYECAINENEITELNILLLGVFKNLTNLYLPFTRSTLFQFEGRFQKARDELAKALGIANEANKLIDEYAKDINANRQVIKIYEPVLSIIPIFIRGSDVNIQAEIFLQKGNILRYFQLLTDAVAEFRLSNQLKASSNPIFLALKSACTTFADRLENKIEFLIAEHGSRYLSHTGDKIFIIHGHDEANLSELKTLLEGTLKLKTVVLKKEAGAGKALIEKFEEYASDCCYAFAIFTPDDFVNNSDTSYFQSRQNVLFELGWFFGHFGRDRVCIIKKDNTEIPSDLAGIQSIGFYENISDKFLAIKAELQRVGILKTDD